MSYEVLSAEASEEQIAQLIGIPYEVFTNTVIFAQATSKSTAKNFIDCTDGERKDLFRTMFNLQNYGDAYDLIWSEHTEFQKGIEKLNQEIELANNSKLHLENQLASLQQASTNFKNDQASELEKYNGVIKSLSSEISEDKVKEDSTFIELFSKVKNRIDELEKEIARLSNLISEKKIKQKLIEEEREKLYVSKQSIESLSEPENPGECEALINEQKELAETISGLTSHLKEEQKYLDVTTISKLEKEVAQTKDSLDKENVRIKALEDKKHVLEHQCSSLKECPTCKQSLTPELSKSVSTDILKEIQKIEVELDNYRSSNLLEILGQKEVALGDFIAKANPELIKEIEEALSSSKIEKTQVDNKIKEFSDKKTAWSLYNEKQSKLKETILPRIQEILDILFVLVSEIDVTEKLLIPLTNEIKEQSIYLEANKDRYAKSLDNVSQYTFKKNQLNEAKKSLEEISKKTFPQRTELVTTIGQLGECEGNLKTLNEKQSKFSSDQKDFQNLISAFGNEGIVAELFKEYMPAMQDLANEYSLALTNNEIRLDFECEKQLKDKSKTRSQFNITIKKNNGGTNEFISGSEQRKAALICSLALAELGVQYSNISTNIRVYDEIFDSLDQRSVERLVEFLTQKNNSFITFVISHKKDIEDSFVNKIELKINEGVTEVCL